MATRKKTTKKTTKKAAAKKTKSPKKTSKLKSLAQTHGKDETQPQTLDQIWGDDGTWKYKTMNLEVYEQYLKNLNKSDLQEHATIIGLVPIDNSQILMKRLTAEFKKHVNAYSVPKQRGRKEKISDEVKKILREGR